MKLRKIFRLSISISALLMFHIPVANASALKIVKQGLEEWFDIDFNPNFLGTNNNSSDPAFLPNNDASKKMLVYENIFRKFYTLNEQTNVAPDLNTKKSKVFNYSDYYTNSNFSSILNDENLKKLPDYFCVSKYLQNSESCMKDGTNLDLDYETTNDIRFFYGEQDKRSVAFAFRAACLTGAGRTFMEKTLKNPTVNLNLIKKRQAFIKKLVEDDELFQSLEKELISLSSHEGLLYQVLAKDDVSSVMSPEVRDFSQFLFGLFGIKNWGRTFLDGFDRSSILHNLAYFTTKIEAAAAMKNVKESLINHKHELFGYPKPPAEGEDGYEEYYIKFHDLKEKQAKQTAAFMDKDESEMKELSKKHKNLGEDVIKNAGELSEYLRLSSKKQPSPQEKEKLQKLDELKKKLCSNKEGDDLAGFVKCAALHKKKKDYLLTRLSDEDKRLLAGLYDKYKYVVEGDDEKSYKALLLNFKNDPAKISKEIAWKYFDNSFKMLTSGFTSVAENCRSVGNNFANEQYLSATISGLHLVLGCGGQLLSGPIALFKDLTNHQKSLFSLKDKVKYFTGPFEELKNKLLTNFVTEPKQIVDGYRAVIASSKFFSAAENLSRLLEKNSFLSARSLDHCTGLKILQKIAEKDKKAMSLFVKRYNRQQQLLDKTKKQLFNKNTALRLELAESYLEYDAKRKKRIYEELSKIEKDIDEVDILKQRLAWNSPNALSDLLQMLKSDDFAKKSASYFRPEKLGIFHIGKMRATAKQIYLSKMTIAPALVAIGEIDAMMAVARLCRMQKHSPNNKFCFVNFVESEDPVFDCKGLWSPAAARTAKDRGLAPLSYLEKLFDSNSKKLNYRFENPYKWMDLKQNKNGIDFDFATSSDVSLGGLSTNKHMLLTGKNGDGKSTFIRSMAHAVMLAQTFGIVPAQSARMTIFHVMRSIKKDLEDPSRGISSHNGQLIKVKSYLNNVKKMISSGKRVLVFADELFNGTNAVDAAKLVKTLGMQIAQNYDGSMWVLSSHAQKSPEVEDYTNKAFGNFHIFERRLRPGAIPHGISSNKELLELAGYSKEFVNAFDEMRLN